MIVGATGLIGSALSELLQNSNIPLVEHHSVTDVPVTYVVPVKQVPLGVQEPVKVYDLTQSLGLPVSPLNLRDNAFETPSYKGSFSGYFALTSHAQLQPQAQLFDVPPDIW